ncbi:hypothetical protein JW865_09215 [Candidatus Bathyarchaeota archaeon]|nr:hypothetical protein [Candidatus Bathyarchaeota archaeon]
MNFNVMNKGFNPYFFGLSFTFLVLGYLNYVWSFLRIDPILMGLYLFVDGIELIMWVSKFFGLLTSFTFSIILTISFVHLAIMLSKPKSSIELTL